jgi:hypothetical protein
MKPESEKITVNSTTIEAMAKGLENSGLNSVEAMLAGLALAAEIHKSMYTGNGTGETEFLELAKKIMAQATGTMFAVHQAQ